MRETNLQIKIQLQAEFLHQDEPSKDDNMPPLSEVPPNQTKWPSQDGEESSAPLDHSPLHPSNMVRFQDDVRILEVPRLSEEEKEACWMRKEDYLNIRREAVSLIQRSMSLFATGGPPTDLRGLEHKTPNGLYRRQQNKMGAIQTVLEEQKFQSMRGFSDPDWIAAKYQESVRRCSIEAKIMGVRDEIAIKENIPSPFKEHGLSAVKYFSSRMEI